jgi:anti-sigma factor RsiW
LRSIEDGNAMSWSCDQIEAQLSDYLEASLPAEAQAQFAAHIASCSRCAPLAQRVGSMLRAIHALEPLPVPPQLIRSILERTSGAQTSSRAWRAWFGWTRWLLTPRFAYGALTVFLTLTVISQALGVRLHRPTLADLNPVNIYRAADRQAHLLYARSSKFVADLRVVYEIQSRLAPATTPAPPPDTAPSGGSKGNGHSKATPPTPQQDNRIAASPFPLTRVASILLIAPLRLAATTRSPR